MVIINTSFYDVFFIEGKIAATILTYCALSSSFFVGTKWNVITYLVSKRTKFWNNKFHWGLSDQKEKIGICLLYSGTFFSLLTGRLVKMFVAQKTPWMDIVGRGYATNRCDYKVKMFMHISLGLLQARLIVLHSALFINSTVLLTYLVQLIYDQLQCIWMVDRPWKLLASLDGIKFKYIKLPICFLRYFYC